jgi:hypothetical protein
MPEMDLADTFRNLGFNVLEADTAEDIDGWPDFYELFQPEYKWKLFKKIDPFSDERNIELFTVDRESAVKIILLIESSEYSESAIRQFMNANHEIYFHVNDKQYVFEEVEI